MPVIPDSIEPYVGYKALTIGDDTALYSPSESSILWPPRRPLGAVCTRTGEWSWVPVEGAARRPYEGRRVVPTAKPEPTNPLPPGWSWSWEALTHDAPAQGCSCGIYAVNDPAGCLSYVKPDGVIVEVAVWGNVVPASGGVRGQYAYPQRILAPKLILEEVRPTAILYGIPILVLDGEMRVEQEQIDISNMGTGVKQTIPGKTQVYMEPAELLGEMIAASDLPPAVPVKAEDPVLKALKSAAKRLRGEE